MKRGISQILTSLMLVLIVLSIAALIYPWASSIVSSLSQTFYQSTSSLKTSIGSLIEIYPPPAVIPGLEANYPVIIHNAGTETVAGVRVYIIPPSGGSPVYLLTQKIDINGDIEPLTSAPQDLAPGDGLIAYMPESNNYIGYTIVVTARNILVPYTVVIG